MIKFKNWMIKLAIKGLVKSKKDVCKVIEDIITKIDDKYNTIKK